MFPWPLEPMADLSDEACAERLRTALDLADAGIRMRLAQLRRNDPAASDEQIRERLQRWLLERNGKHTDADGQSPEPSGIS